MVKAGFAAEGECMIKLTGKEKEIVQMLGDPIYTVKYLEEWINRNDDVSINAVAALTAMGAKGYYRAIQHITEQNQGNTLSVQ